MPNRRYNKQVPGFKEGGKVLLGGKRAANFNKGYYYEPTIFDDVKDNFTVMKEEPFGPIVPILTFKDFDEVMERANDNDLGLCSYIYTTDLKKANKAHVIGKSSRGNKTRDTYSLMGFTDAYNSAKKNCKNWLNTYNVKLTCVMMDILHHMTNLQKEF